MMYEYSAIDPREPLISVKIFGLTVTMLEKIVMDEIFSSETNKG